MRNIGKNYSKIIAIILLCSAVFSSCKKYKSDLDLSSSARINALKANGVSGTIDESTKTITLLLPLGSDLSAVNPEITLPAGATIAPAAGTVMDMTQPVTYRVANGNIYSDYTVKATVEPAFTSFKVNGVAGTIDDIGHTIAVTLPPGSDLTALKPDFTASSGLTVTPATGTVQDFTSPVNYKVTSSVATFDYKVTVQTAIYIGFVGTAANRAGITNPDEKAAADWLFTAFPYADYVSFNDIKAGTATLSKYKAIWWHFDSAQSLPDIANDADVINRLKAYYAGGGNFFLTTYAALYLPVLGIVPPFKGSNNVFGDSSPNPGGNWGINFNGRESHPLFQGLALANAHVAYLISDGTERLNHTAWWKVNEWGGYTNAAGWRAQTGGIDLATVDGDDNRDVTCGIAEFPSKSGSGKTLVIALGAYDWYAEPIPGTNTQGPANSYLPNIKRMSLNALNYLTK